MDRETGRDADFDPSATSSRDVWIGTGWKMNKTRAEALAWADAVAGRVPAGVRAFVLPPFTCLHEVAERLAGTNVAVGAQNVHWDDAGAWTGEVSGPMLRDCGATLVEIGHSERRAHFGETDETVARRVEAALRHGLVPLICIGETAAERDAGRAGEVLERQTRTALRAVAGDPAEVLLAYEPVWAIGEGGTPADPDTAEARQARAAEVAASVAGRPVPVLYGGSVTPDNAAGFLARPAVAGLFVGRAAWDADGFLALADIGARRGRGPT